VVLLIIIKNVTNIYHFVVQTQTVLQMTAGIAPQFGEYASEAAHSTWFNLSAWKVTSHDVTTSTTV